MRSLCLKVENEFLREGIRIEYQDGEFVVYGASPSLRSAIKASIVSQAPCILPCRVSFQSMMVWEDEQNVI